MRACYIISYDIAANGDEDALVEAIRDYGTWAHLTESTWAVVTDFNAAEIRDDLGSYLPRGSRVFVVKSGTESAWRNVFARSEWLKGNL